jgi:sulfhydrogenase subunit delta
MKKRKLKFGFFSFTCCEGCIVVFIESLNKKFDEWNNKIDIKVFRALKSNEAFDELDYAIVEGAISTESEARKLKEIREKSKKLIALGSGACNGYPSNQRNKFDDKKLKEIKVLIKKLNQNKTIEPLNKFVKVDDQIQGCPVDEADLIKKIDSYIKNA